MSEVRGQKYEVPGTRVPNRTRVPGTVGWKGAGSKGGQIIHRLSREGPPSCSNFSANSNNQPLVAGRPMIEVQ